MSIEKESAARPPLLLVTGAKGAVASTLAVAVCALQTEPGIVVPSLTTASLLPIAGRLAGTRMAGWDSEKQPLTEIIDRLGIVDKAIWQKHKEALDDMPVITPPDVSADSADQVKKISEDIETMRRRHPGCRPVLINLLPAAGIIHPEKVDRLSRVYEAAADLPDLLYVMAALQSGVPVVNFTPNPVEIPFIVDLADKEGIPIAGCDGKTGQTYFKVVLASALKARCLEVDGWYSLNILGNADGRNLMDPERAAAKLANKTELLDDILGYRVGGPDGEPSHMVRIDYYPPRKDAKEAWDVVDIKGLFGMTMGLRLNLQGRDSILAAPMALDLGIWLAALQAAGRGGLMPELAFYFKKPVGPDPPLTYQDQVAALQSLAKSCGFKPPA